LISNIIIVIQFRLHGDLIGDQILPLTNIGTDYAVATGSGNTTGEQIYVMATENSTTVTFKPGSGSDVSTILQAGETYAFDNKANSNAYTEITSGTKPVYVFHTSGVGNELGGAMVPPVTCTGSRSVSFMRPSANTFEVMVVTKSSFVGNFVTSHAGFLLSSGDFTQMNGGDYYYAKKSYTTAQIPINEQIDLSNTAGYFQMGFLARSSNDDGGWYGYISDFSSIAATTTASPVNVCDGSETTLTTTYSSKNTYEWSSSETSFSATTYQITVSPEEKTTYTVEVTNEDQACTTTDEVVVDVWDSPTISSVVIVDADCEDAGNITVNATSANETPVDFIAKYQFPSGALTLTTATPDNPPDNTTFANVSLGGGITTESVTDKLAATSWGTADSYGGTDYWEFTITPDAAGKTITFTPSDVVAFNFATTSIDANDSIQATWTTDNWTTTNKMVTEPLSDGSTVPEEYEWSCTSTIMTSYTTPLADGSVNITFTKDNGTHSNFAWFWIYSSAPGSDGDYFSQSLGDDKSATNTVSSLDISDVTEFKVEIREDTGGDPKTTETCTRGVGGGGKVKGTVDQYQGNLGDVTLAFGETLKVRVRAKSLDEADDWIQIDDLTVTGRSYSTSVLMYDIGSGAQASNVFPTVLPGTYTVTVSSDQGGCATTSEAIVLQDDGIDDATATITGGSTMCDGDANKTITAGGTGAAAYLWSNGGTQISISVAPGVTTTYTVTVTDGNGDGTDCKDRADVVLTVTRPNAAITGEDVICKSASTTLTAAGGATYKWNDNSTDVDLDVGPLTTATDFTVTITDATSCTDTESFTVDMKPNSAFPQIHSVTADPAINCVPETGATISFNVSYTALGTPFPEIKYEFEGSGAVSTRNTSNESNKMLNFAGSGGDDENAYIENGPDLSPNSFSIEFWCRRETATSNDMVFGMGNNAASNEALHMGYLADETFRFTFYGNEMDYASAIGEDDTDWHHWAGTYDATTNERKLYKDGTWVKTDSPTDDYLGNDQLFIGKYTSGDWFDGDIDEVRVWGTVRSESQIENNMFNMIEFGSDDHDDLLAYYKFDHSSSTTLADSSGNKYHATLYQMDDETDWVDSDAFAYPVYTTPSTVNSTSPTGLTDANEADKAKFTGWEGNENTEYIDFSIDGAAGLKVDVSSGTLYFDVETNSINTGLDKIRVQYKLDGGSWTDVPSGAVDLGQD